ncbi:MAG: L-histidine N(alpha)-methyltransferase [Pseudomonadota bacterium]
MTPLSAPLAFHDFQPDADDFFQDAAHGLSKPQKELPAKYFYDERGSRLFDEICDAPEYYPTRTEIRLLQDYAPDIAAIIGARCVLIEYGSGSSRKVPLLLRALREPLAYVPVDICREYLLASSATIAAAHPHLAVTAVCADYTRLTHLPRAYPCARKVVFFPGSTIGNYTPMEAIRLLRNAARLVGEGGGMLIGVDLKKSPALLHAAYNDARGVTARFNLNMLARMNRELQTDFDLNNFAHHAYYHAARGRIEMHLCSLCTQTVRMAAHGFHFRAGETIHTENSYKYTVEEFQMMAEAADFKPMRVWTDARRLFSLHYLEAC